MPRVLRDVVDWFELTDHGPRLRAPVTLVHGTPVTLVHGVACAPAHTAVEGWGGCLGVFGAGKSHLMVVIVTFLFHVLERSGTADLRILITAITNVAGTRL